MTFVALRPPRAARRWTDHGAADRLPLPAAPRRSALRVDERRGGAGAHRGDAAASAEPEAGSGA